MSGKQTFESRRTLQQSSIRFVLQHAASLRWYETIYKF